VIVRTRFAPSPTGPLHLGHAYAALVAYDLAHEARGEFLLRIEDIDPQRSKPQWERQIADDLRWLGLSWPEPVMRQSERLATSPDEVALRLDLARALAEVPALAFQETGTASGRKVVEPERMIREVGDVVLARRDFGTSYHLSVVVDDAAQDVTLVTRGEDLAEVTPIHVLLQRLLDLPTPTYHHHRLIRDDAGRRLAKREDAKAIARYRAEGATPDDIRRMVGL
jgi:glutamyl-Q tRNA(Asp) synthetase